MNENVKAFVQGLIDNPPADLALALARDPDLRVRYFREFDLDDPLYPHLVHADAERALPELIRRASLGQTITFTEYVEFLGRGNKRRVNGGTINAIAALCITRGLPPLWTLLVRAATGLPANFWREHTDKEKADRQNECFAYYGAVREPEGGVLALCPTCFTERTPSGTCMC